MTIQIYPFDSGCFVLSVNNVWQPGVYRTKQAAEMAAHKDAEDLENLWDSKFPEPITEDDLK